MEKIVNILDWKHYFQDQQYEVLGGPFVWYSRHYSRLLFYFGLVYALAFQTTGSISCDQTHADMNPHFVSKMCVMPYYAAHTWHSSPYRLEQGNFRSEAHDHMMDSQLFKFDYYIWIYVIVIALSFVAYLPWLQFQAKQSEMLDQLRALVKFIDYFPLEQCGKCAQKDKHRFELRPTEASHETKPKQLYSKAPSKEQLLSAHTSAFRVACAIQKVLLDPGCKSFVLSYFAAQMYAICSIVSQMMCLNWIFHGFYRSYGWRWLQFWLGWSSHYPQENIFPFIATCHFKMYGLSGSPKNVDSLCIMHYNVLNQYTFTFVWFALVCFFLVLLCSLVHAIIRLMSCQFERQVHQHSCEIARVFALINDRRNINRLYDQEHLSKQIYFWSFVMLALTNINLALLIEKIQDLQPLLKVTSQMMMLDELENQTKASYFKKTDQKRDS